jgi:lysophospholipase L1-like esterase
VWTTAPASSAEANGAVFVSFYDLVNEPGHDEDARAKGWIGEDGFHANETGAAAAATALAAVGFERSEQPR